MKTKAFTLIEMLVAVAVLGIVFPLIFSVINGSFKELRKMESVQSKNFIESRLISRLDEDFRTFTRFNFLKADSISFYTMRSNSTQQLVTYRIDNNSITYQINNSNHKLLVNGVNIENTKFHFLEYGDDPKIPQGDEFSQLEMNTLSKIKLNYQFSIGDEQISDSYVKLRRLD